MHPSSSWEANLAIYITELTQLSHPSSLLQYQGTKKPWHTEHYSLNEVH